MAPSPICTTATLTLLPPLISGLSVGSHSWVTPLPPTTYEVLELLQSHGQRFLQNHPANPASGVLPLDGTDHARQNPPANQQPQENDNVRNHSSNNKNNKATAQSTQGPTQQYLTKLQMLLSQPFGSTFRGSAYIQTTVPSVKSVREIGRLCPAAKGGRPSGFRFALMLCDGDGKGVNALVSDPIGEKLFAMSSKDVCGNGADSAFDFLSSCIEERRRWDVQVKSVQMKGKRFFLLTSIKAGKAGS